MLFVLVMLASVSSLVAEDDFIGHQDLERLALQHNPDLKVTFHQWQSALLAVSSARSLPDPTLTYTEFLEEVQTRVGSQRRKVSLMQMFPWFGTLKVRGDAALAKAEVLAKQLEDQRLGVLERVRLSLYDLILLERKVEIHQSHLKILQDLENSRKGGLAAGRGHLSSVLKLQVEIEALRDQILTLEAMRTPFRQKLERATGVDLTGHLPSTWPPMESLPSIEECESLYRQHPQWQANQKALDVAHDQVTLAQKKGRPNLGVGFSWIDTGPALMPNTVGSGDDPLTVTLSLSIPLWRGKVNDDIQRAVQTKMATESSSEVLLQEFRYRVREQRFQWEDSERKIKLYRDQLLPKARDAYESARKGHESNVVSFQSVLDAERMLLRFDLELETAWRDQASAQAQLQRLIGSSLTKN